MPPTPRNEYPRPQMVRRDWLCLNGPWQFEIDPGDSGLERGLKDRPLKDQILVPFCPESSLSGIGNVDFMNAVWYRREVTIPSEWKDRDVLLHFQACDQDTTVWVNGIEVVRHRGAWTPFSASLRGIAAPGDTCTIVVRARDLGRTPSAAGKQSGRYENYSCFYVRTTGIWQTVWMEPVSAVHFSRPRITPNVEFSRFDIITPLTAPGVSVVGHTVRVRLLKDACVIAQAESAVGTDFSPAFSLTIPKEHVVLWEPGKPFLYDLEMELVDASGRVVDRIQSYSGLRSVAIDGKRVLINGRSVFQRLVLDQGYYPDGILTAPTDQALVDDIRLSMEAGFNGARLHQKVFEERFLYHADRMGYLCWGEFGDWGIDRTAVPSTYVAQWLETLHRDYNHPCIIGWCGLNETAETITDRISGLDDLTRAFFLAAKAIDTTRPVLDASGYSHRVLETDIYDCHDYDQDPVTFRERHIRTGENQVFQNPGSGGNNPQVWSVPYRGQPYFVSEFGGALWNPDASPNDASWGYGNRPKTIEEFYDRFEKLCGVLLENPAHFGYCYTQLTDVFQEKNGLYRFDRSPKFDVKRLRDAQTRRAAIER